MRCAVQNSKLWVCLYDGFCKRFFAAVIIRLTAQSDSRAHSKYPSMTNKEVIQYTSVLFTQGPTRVFLAGPNIDSRTVLVTMYYCG